MFQTRQALNSLRSIAEWMSAIQGRRKAIIYISEGVDYNLFDIFTGGDPSNFNFENFNMVQTETWDTVSAASRSNVQIYPVDPRGLTTMGQEDIEIGGLAAGAYGLGPKQLLQELQTSQQNLRQLAEETGGVAFVGPQRLRRGVRSHRPGEQLVLRARVLLDQRQARRQAAQHHRARRRVSRSAGHLSQALRRAARPRAEEHGGRQAARSVEEPDGRAHQHDGVAAAEDGHSASRHRDREERRRQEQRRRSAHRHARQGSDVHGKERHVQQPFVAVGRRLQQARQVGVRRAARRRSESAARDRTRASRSMACACCGICRCRRDATSCASRRRTAAR